MGANMQLTEEMALEAYARMINTLDVSPLEPLLAEDFHYASQMVFSEIESKVEYLDYIVPKLETIGNSNSQAWAEMGWLGHGSHTKPCVVLAQGDPDELVALVLAKVNDRHIKRLDLCIVPHPQTAQRSGAYPGLSVGNSTTT
jgi:hypothetical protein